MSQNLRPILLEKTSQLCNKFRVSNRLPYHNCAMAPQSSSFIWKNGCAAGYIYIILHRLCGIPMLLQTQHELESVVPGTTCSYLFLAIGAAHCNLPNRFTWWFIALWCSAMILDHGLLCNWKKLSRSMCAADLLGR